MCKGAPRIVKGAPSFLLSFCLASSFYINLKVYIIELLNRNNYFKLKYILYVILYM